MATKLTFITSTGSRLDDSSLKAMRRHVTKENFLQRRLRKKGHQSATHSDIPNSTTGDDGKVMLATDKDLTVFYRASPLVPRVLFAQQYPAQLITLLMQVFKPVFFSQNSTVYNNLEEQDWINLVFSDRAMLEASLCLAETHRRLLGQGEVDGTVVNLHKQNAMHIIRQRLSDPTLRITDGTMNAVMSLAYSEQLAKNTTAWKTHVSGLCQMVKIRRTKDGTLPVFIELFCFASVNAAISATIESSQMHNRSCASKIGSNFEFLIYENTVRVEVLDIAIAIFQTQSILDDIRSGDTADDIIDRSVKDVQRKLMSFSINGSYTKTLCISITIFLCLIRPRHTADPTLLSRLAVTLMKARISPKIRFRSSMDMIFWQHTIGAIAATGTPTRQYFMCSLRELVPKLNLHSWDDAKMILRLFFWLDDVLSGPCRQIWDELETFRDLSIPSEAPVITYNCSKEFWKNQ